MPDNHVVRIEAQITALSAALADLGRGTSLRDLLKIIHNPGWTTLAETSLVISAIEAMATQAAAIAQQQTSLLAAAKQVGAQTHVAA